MKYRLIMKESYREISFIFEKTEEIVSFIKTASLRYGGEEGLTFLVEPVGDEDEKN